MTGDGEQERQVETATGRREDERMRWLPLQREEEQRKGRGCQGSFLSIFLNRGWENCDLFFFFRGVRKDMHVKLISSTYSFALKPPCQISKPQSGRLRWIKMNGHQCYRLYLPLWAAVRWSLFETAVRSPASCVSPAWAHSCRSTHPAQAASLGHSSSVTHTSAHVTKSI